MKESGETEGSSSSEDSTYEVVLSSVAKRALEDIRSLADRKSVDKVLCILGTVPGIGRRYDPLYEVARPDVDVMVAYAGHFGIYYEVLEESKIVAVYYIEDQRRDPMNRFNN